MSTNKEAQNEARWAGAQMGKLPPQSVDAEEAVIGAALSSTYDARQAMTYLTKPHFFYKEAHQRIWNAIMILSEKGDGIDIITVSNQLRSLGELEIAGGTHYLMLINNKVASSAHLQEHCLLVKQDWIKRENIRLGSQMLQKAFDDTTDAFELLAEARQGLDDIALGAQVHQEATIASVASFVVKEAAERMGKPISTIFIPTWVPDYDRKMGGYAKGEPDLNILAARPRMGKSAVFSFEISEHIRNDIPVGVFTLEMSMTQLVNRMMVAQAEGQVDNTQLKYGSFNKDQYLYLERGASILTKTPCPIYDKGGLDVRTLRTIALQWKEKYDIQLLYIDYLQLLGYGNVTDSLKRNTMVSITLKNLAKELGIPVNAIASLNREADKREGHRPIMADLRESGQIESDADLVRFIVRENCYNPAVDYREMLFIVDKNRHGQAGDILTYFDVATNRPVTTHPVLPPRPNYKEFSEPLHQQTIEPDF